jgi:hypothetical protein
MDLNLVTAVTTNQLTATNFYVDEFQLAGTLGLGRPVANDA